VGVTPGGQRRRLAKWIAPAALVIGLAALAFAASRSIADRSPFEFGLLYVVWRYEQALSLAGLGLAFAQMRRRLLMLNAAIFAGGVPLGGFVANWIAAALAGGADIYGSLLLVGPGCLVITGLALVSPAVIRAWLLPPATLASAVVLGMVMNFSDPTIEEQSFAAGAILGGAWLVATPYLLWRRFERPWFSIPARIFGSWLIAIGVMIGALYLIPPRV
jgi:hypothetical protein